MTDVDVRGDPRSTAADVEFEAFVLGCSQRLLGVAYMLTGDRGHAEDLLQTALLRTLRHWRVARDAPEAYVRRALVNLSRNRWRHLSRRPGERRFDGDLPEPREGDWTHEVLERNAITLALQQLPVRQRQVVVLRFLADLSVAETAATIGCSQGAVKSHCNRAIARLRELLTQPASTSTTAPELTHTKAFMTADPGVLRAD